MNERVSSTVARLLARQAERAREEGVALPAAPARMAQARAYTAQDWDRDLAATKARNKVKREQLAEAFEREAQTQPMAGGVTWTARS